MADDEAPVVDSAGAASLLSSCTITSKDGEDSGKGGGETKDEAIPSAVDDRVTRARSTIVHPIVADSGTITKQEATYINDNGSICVKFHDQACICMFSEMVEDGVMCHNFYELADLTVRIGKRRGQRRGEACPV